jgi:phosphoribosylformimino-5-aminoimidazole carboxamide ribotide isomerase
MFEIIPAIDVRGGRCVRLFQGDYAQETMYGEDPVAVARAWQAAGAARLHVVDLDCARAGRPVNSSVISAIVREMTIPVQVGGGIRNLESASGLLEAGVARVVYGTVALQAPEVLVAALEQHGPERVVIAIDARDGRVAAQGWLQQTEVSALDLARRLASAGVVRVLYTDIARDGTLAGPNVEAIRRLVAETRLAVIASGGVSRAEHIRELVEAGAEAAIVGKALYTGDLLLADAIAAAQGVSA